MGIFLEGMEENGSQTWLRQRQAKDGREGDGNRDGKATIDGRDGDTDSGRGRLRWGHSGRTGMGAKGDAEGGHIRPRRGPESGQGWARRGHRGKAASGRETEISLDGDTLGQIARLVDIQALGDSYMIREELERDD